MTRKVLLSIIIATINRPGKLQDCVNSINHVFKDSIEDVEIIVVDQSIKQAEIRSKINIKHFRSSPGASKARNYGAGKSTGSYLWFFDDDAILSKFTLQKLNSDRSAYFINWNERNTRAILNTIYKRLYILRNSGTPMYVVKAKLFRSIGGFDEKIGPGRAIAGGEDADFILRCNVEKCISYEPIGEFSHPIETKNSEKLIAYARYRGFILRKNRLTGLIALHVIYYLAISMFRRNRTIHAFMKGLIDSQI